MTRCQYLTPRQCPGSKPMALFVPTIAGQISGSIGAIVFSHNAGGAYMRQKVTPTDPGTIQQTTVRAIMTTLSNRWSDVLSASQRSAWNVYAANVPRPGPGGGLRNISGIAHYVRSNLPRVQADATGAFLPIVDDGPTTFNVGSYTVPSATIATPYTSADVAFTNTDAWANENQAAMLLWFGRPISPAINFFKGPYRSALFVLGNGTTPPVSPQATLLPFPASAAVQMRFRVNVTRADGRLSDDAKLQCVIV